MIHKKIILIFAIVFLAVGFGVTHEAFLQLLGPNFSDLQREIVRPGTLVLKSLFIADGLLLLGFVIFFDDQNESADNYRAMWIGKPSPAMPKLVKLFCPITWGLVLAALVIRTIGLDTDLWMDEVFTVVESVRPSIGEILAIYSSDNQHTLYSLLAKICIEIFGEHPWSLRLPAVAFGVASIWALARIGRLTFGVREALLTSLFCVLFYHHIWFSQNARGYTILMFVALISTDFLLRGLETGRWRFWIGYAVFISLGAFAHLTGVFIAIGHALVIAAVLLKEGKIENRRLRPIIAILLSAWLTIHFYALMIPQLIDFFDQPAMQINSLNVEWQNPVWLATEALQQIGINTYLGWPGLIGVVVVIGWVGYLFIRRDWVFTLAAFLPALITFLILIALERSLWPRMFFSQIGFIVLFLVAGLVSAGDYVKGRFATANPTLSFGLVTMPTILLCVASILMLPKLYKYPKQDYRAARDFVKQRAEPADRVVGLHMAGRVYQLYYAPDWPEVNTVADLAIHQSETGSTWVLYTLPRFIARAKPDVANLLENEFEVIKIFPGSLSDGEIIVSRSKKRTLEKK